MHKHKTMDLEQVETPVNQTRTEHGATTGTDLPFSSHPSQVEDQVDESMMVMTANNISMPSKRRRSKQPKSAREHYAFKTSYMERMAQPNKVITLKRNSPVLREAFYSLIMLSTKLIDINWDKTILQTCVQATDDKDTVNDEQAQKLRMIKRQQEALDLVYERMYKKFAKELWTEVICPVRRTSSSSSKTRCHSIKYTSRITKS